MDPLEKDLLSPIRLWSRPVVLSLECPVPRLPGVYAWFFRQIPPGVPVAGCRTFSNHTFAGAAEWLLYCYRRNQETAAAPVSSVMTLPLRRVALNNYRGKIWVYRHPLDKVKFDLARGGACPSQKIMSAISAESRSASPISGLDRHHPDGNSEPAW